MKNKKLFLILFLWVLLFPLISLAGEYQTKDGQTIKYNGLVPCGKTEVGDGEHGAVTMPCTLCHVFVMLNGVVVFLVEIVFLIGVLMIVIAGSTFIYGTMISPGNPGLVSDAKKIITSTIIGLVIIFGAWVFVNAFFLAIGAKDWTGLTGGAGGWDTIKCDIELPPGAYAPPAPLAGKPALAGRLALAKGNGSVLSANIGGTIDLGINFASQSPVSNMHIAANFNNDLLELVNIIPNTAGSNFKTFLPIKDDGAFDKEKIIQQANKIGAIKDIGATCFDFNTGEFADPQNAPVESLFTFVFKAKQKGAAEVILDSENSAFPVLDNENITDILEKENTKIEIIINE